MEASSYLEEHANQGFLGGKMVIPILGLRKNDGSSLLFPSMDWKWGKL